MTDREKLIALLKGTEINRINGHAALAETCFTPNVFEKMADHLIANGVEIYSEEDEKVLKMARQRAMEAHGDLRYLQGVKFGVESATKHGRWEWIEDSTNNCSACGHTTFFYPCLEIVPNYCPNCGAKMDGAKMDGAKDG